VTKYRARKTEIDGLQFDSQHEASRWCELQVMAVAGKVRGLRRQVPYELVPAFEAGGKRYRPMRYIADFVYERDGRTVVEDAKGVRTPAYKIKAKLMAWRHGIIIEET